MNSLLKIGTIIAIFTTSALLAKSTDQAPGEENAVLRENAKVIMAWKREQRAKELASQLALSPEQVGKLRAIKGECDRIRGDYEDEIDALHKKLETLSTNLRKKIETSQNTDAGMEEEIHQVRGSLRRTRHEMGLKIQLACLDLPEILNEEQRDQLKAAIGEMRGKVSAGKEFRQRADSGRSKGLKKGQAGRFGKLAVGRLLLSDAFLNQYP
jgi:dynactin complex subunit